jgi:hypothetical protein
MFTERLDAGTSRLGLRAIQVSAPMTEENLAGLVAEVLGLR